MSFKRKPPEGNVRRVRSTGQNLRGVITNKVGRSVQFESWLERSLILRLDRDPGVRDYQSQPEQFHFMDEAGKGRSYTPDFKVWRQDGTIQIHEVSLGRRRMQANMRRREEAAVAICQERGWQYVVHTERSLPDGSELANLLALVGYRPTIYANQSVIERVYDQLGGGQPVSFAKLVRQVGQKLQLTEAAVTGTVCYLLWHGEVQTDLNRLIFDQGVIEAGIQLWLGHKEVSDEG